MNVLIVYDSVFGNTAKIASAIQEGFESNAKVKLVQISKVKAEHLANAEIIIVGSPTRQFRPTKEISEFIKNIPSKSLKGKSIAAFDTRILLYEIKSSFLRFMVDKGGYAAKTIAKQLKKKGGNLVLHPEGFIVTGEKGPLAPNEIERAQTWAKSFF